ncbi:MAG: hypothetical protein L0241_26920, partial [Planctomycetia bacterium]|nr:hypothetical protein [Planctomycetia bacterium]
MIRAVLLLVFVLLAASSATAADLPPGAILRLGDDRFRSAGWGMGLALSPDGKQLATQQATGDGLLTVTVWDSATGKPVRSHDVNFDLYRGFVWGPGGGFVVVLRADPGKKDEAGTLFPDEFRVWDFANPKSTPPPRLEVSIGFEFPGRTLANRPASGPEYTNFAFSADGRRVAALLKSDKGKHAIEVFELKPAVNKGKLTRARILDLGAEGADAVQLSADGKTLVTFRKLANPIDSHFADYTATVWDVSTGKPARPVRVRDSGRFMLTPDGQSLIVLAVEEKEWGFDLVNLTDGKSRQLVRWPITPPEGEAEGEGEYEFEQWGGCAFFPLGKGVVIGNGRKAVVIDLVAGKELGRLEGHSGTLTAVTVSADGTRIATADDYGLVRLWDAKTLRPLHDASGHRAQIEFAEMSPDGKKLVTWAKDETVRVWDITTGKELRAFIGAVGLRGMHPFAYDQPTFTPDGTAILFNTKDRLIARDILTGLEVPLPGDLAKLGPGWATFAPDGDAVLTCDTPTG